MSSFLYVSLGVIALVIFVIIIIYNGLVYRRNMVRSAFSSIDVNLKKRHDLIPALVETVKGFAKHEKETFTALIEARNELQSASLSDSERFRAEGRVGAQMGRLIALAESYPDLKSSSHFMHLQRSLTEVEEQISASRRSYNAAVLEINNGVQTFPGVLFASRFGFKTHDFFEADVSSRKSINVEL